VAKEKLGSSGPRNLVLFRLAGYLLRW